MKFIEIAKNCDQKMNIGENIECALRRKIIAGLDGCICREDNCIKARKGEQENAADLLPCGHSREYIIFGSKRVFCAICDRSVNG